jgi:Arc/MetJ-type ribon-helix-helix transcriptional regulator
LSTTVSEETHAFLHTLVGSGRAASIAEAVDIAVESAQRVENRARLERDTAAYFEGLSLKAAAQAARLGAALGQMADEIDLEG